MHGQPAAGAVAHDEDVGEVKLQCRGICMGEEGLQIAVHPFPQIGYVGQDVGASGFGHETEVCGDDDGAVEEGEVEDPIREEEGEERGPNYLFYTEN